LIRAQWTVANVAIMRRAPIAKAEEELIITLAIGAPPWITVVTLVELTTVATRFPMRTVGIAVSSDLQGIVTPH